MYFVEYGKYIFELDEVIWRKRKFKTLECAVCFVFSNNRAQKSVKDVITSLDQITFVSKDKLYDWKYIKENEIDDPEDPDIIRCESCGAEPAIPEKDD